MTVKVRDAYSSYLYAHLWVIGLGRARVVVPLPSRIKNARVGGSKNVWTGRVFLLSPVREVMKYITSVMEVEKW